MTWKEKLKPCASCGRLVQHRPAETSYWGHPPFTVWHPARHIPPGRVRRCKGLGTEAPQ